MSRAGVIVRTIESILAGSAASAATILAAFLVRAVGKATGILETNLILLAAGFGTTLELTVALSRLRANPVIRAFTARPSTAVVSAFHSFAIRRTARAVLVANLVGFAADIVADFLPACTLAFFRAGPGGSAFTAGSAAAVISAFSLFAIGRADVYVQLIFQSVIPVDGQIVPSRFQSCVDDRSGFTLRTTARQFRTIAGFGT